jgi:hypothetical protein
VSAEDDIEALAREIATKGIPLAEIGVKYCPRFKSQDIVGYWDIKANQDKPGDPLGTRVMNSTLRYIYPTARKCVDCEAVWW